LLTRVRITIVPLEKQIRITYFQCVTVALVNQVRCTEVYCRLWPVWLHHIFPHYLIMSTFSGKKKVIELGFFKYNFRLKHFSLYEFNKIRSQMYLRLHIKYSLFLSDFSQTWVFSTEFRKILKYQVHGTFVNASRNERCTVHTRWIRLWCMLFGGKQWQTTPKNLPRMQRTRAIPVAWLSSGICPDRPKGWIPIIKIISMLFT